LQFFGLRPAKLHFLAVVVAKLRFYNNLYIVFFTEAVYYSVRRFKMADTVALTSRPVTLPQALVLFQPAVCKSVFCSHICLETVHFGIALRLFLLCAFFAGAAGFVFSQNQEENSFPEWAEFDVEQPAGFELYCEGRFLEAAAELRKYHEAAANIDQWTESLYWLILTELALEDYGSAVIDMNRLERRVAESRRAKDILYHRGRAYYFLGYYDEAMALFKKYIDRTGEREQLRKSAAYYWIGECLYSAGLHSLALDFFILVTEQFPDSPKHEAASSRVAMIRQEKIENDLLVLLKWREEELFRTEQQRQDTAHNPATGDNPKQ
jgi:TolA-binding protein